MKKNFSKGYTFIEVLVATLIFTAMIIIVSTGFSQSLNFYRKITSGTLSTKDIFLDRIIYKLVYCATNYYVEYDKKYYLYFYGDESQFSFVSLCPVGENQPSVVHIKKIYENQGSSIKIYQFSLKKTGLTDIDPQSLTKRVSPDLEIEVLKGVEEAKFQYYIFDFQKREYIWKDDIEFKKNYILPKLVMLSYKKEGKKFVKIFTIPVNDTSKEIYNEI